MTWEKKFRFFAVCSEYYEGAFTITITNKDLPIAIAFVLPQPSTPSFIVSAAHYVIFTTGIRTIMWPKTSIFKYLLIMKNMFVYPNFRKVWTRLNLTYPCDTEQYKSSILIPIINTKRIPELEKWNYSICCWIEGISLDKTSHVVIH